MSVSERKGQLALGTSAVLSAGFLAACSHDGAKADYAGVCRDTKTQQRLPDSECDGHHHNTHAGWVYYRMGQRVAPVGGRLNDYATTIPKNATYAAGGFDAQGGKVTSSSVKEGTSIKGSDGSNKGSVVRGGFGKGGGGHGG